LDVNPSVAKHTGLSDARGKRMLELVPGVEDSWFELYGRVALTREPRRFENHVADIGRWFDVYAFPIGEPRRKRVGVIFTDITERRRNQEYQRATERELRRLNASLEHRTSELESANKELEAFSYSVSHDLRAPLRAMDGFSRTLMVDYADKLDDTGKDRLRRVVAASQRMDQLVDGILGLSRLARINLRRTTVDLSAMAETIAVELRRANPQRRVEFAIAPGIVANADATLLLAALENLLGNAWKFTAGHACARIEVGMAQHEGETAYFVRDDGSGFDMAYADKLFGPFQRLHTSAEFEGTGIGLTTVERIVRRHGGRIWAQAEVEKGAAFFFTLPVHSKGIE
jgi:light-regulated signal transduction histidine kinase (bacteriophytochrome)